MGASSLNVGKGTLSSSCSCSGKEETMSGNLKILDNPSQLSPLFEKCKVQGFS